MKADDHKAPPALVNPNETLHSVTDLISGIVEVRRPTIGWFVITGVAFTLLMLLFWSIAYLLYKGIGIWGVDIPVAWGFAIVNFVWWIGIGHAGTFISAFLLLMHQAERTSINRFAEAMTLFAVACAGLFPLLHLGRPWVFYFMLPYPDTMNLWPQWRSPLTWDIFAISTYGLVSLVFWYVGLVPDLATIRDRARNPFRRFIYGLFALGWRGSARHWQRYQTAYMLLAGLAAPLVVSVHSIIGLDFAAAVVPGWHSTIFPPYFVAGAIFSGFAMVLTLAIPIRHFYKLQSLITIHHLDYMAKIMLTTGLMVDYSYILEHFIAWYSGDQYEIAMILNRMFGEYAFSYWIVILCNVVITQFLWFRAIRRNTLILFIVSLLINLGMWVERYMIVITSLYRDFVPSAWGYYAGTLWDWATLFGSFGLFLTLFMLFLRFLPAVSISEARHLIHETHKEQHGGKS